MLSSFRGSYVRHFHFLQEYEDGEEVGEVGYRDQCWEMTYRSQGWFLPRSRKRFIVLWCLRRGLREGVKFQRSDSSRAGKTKA